MKSFLVIGHRPIRYRAVAQRARLELGQEVLAIDENVESVQRIADERDAGHAAATRRTRAVLTARSACATSTAASWPSARTWRRASSSQSCSRSSARNTGRLPRRCPRCACPGARARGRGPRRSAGEARSGSRLAQRLGTHQRRRLHRRFGRFLLFWRSHAPKSWIGKSLGAARRARRSTAVNVLAIRHGEGRRALDVTSWAGQASSEPDDLLVITGYER